MQQRQRHAKKLRQQAVVEAEKIKQQALEEEKLRQQPQKQRR